MTDDASGPHPDRSAGAGPPRPGELRERIWAELMRRHAAAYPLPVHGHHPNFRGAGAAAVALLDALAGAGLLPLGGVALCYPDYVLKPFRKGLLERGVDVVVPARYGGGWRHLASGAVPAAKAASIAGAERHGRPLETLPEVALCAVACVALAVDGAALSKGYGFALPAAVVRSPRVTLAHPLMLVERVPEPDLRVDWYATPEGAVRAAAGK